MISSSHVRRILLPVLLLSVLTACGVTVNLAPEVAATGVSFVEVYELPSVVIELVGSASDDQLPPHQLSVQWEQISGPGTAIFDDATAARTGVRFTEAGTYVLQFSASDGQLTSSAQLSVRVLLNGVGDITGLTQVHHVVTGFATPDEPHPVPSPDPASVTYHPPSGRLFLADSEIDEQSVFDSAGGNLFEISLDGGTLYRTWDLTESTTTVPDNNEPTGIAFCRGHFYVTHDNRALIYRYRLENGVMLGLDTVSTRPFSSDPEGITCDEETGRLYVIGGSSINILVYSYRDDSGFVLEDVLDLFETAGDFAGVPSDPEGIAFDPVSRRLLVVSDPDNAVFEFETTGLFVKRYDLSVLTPRPIAPQGLTVAPSSDGSETMSLYLADGGRDNDPYPDEFEGALYELRIARNGEP